MGNFFNSLSSLIGARADASPERSRDPFAKPPSPPASADATPIDAVSAPGAGPVEPRDLPLVAYAATDEVPLPRPRRSRALSLLRSTSNGAATSHALPALPTVATTRAPAHSTGPLLTETERLRLQVMQAQIKLSVLHLYEGPIDGHMSPATATAVRYFQTLKGIRATGTLAAGTLAALGVPPVG